MKKNVEIKVSSKVDISNYAFHFDKEVANQLIKNSKLKYTVYSVKELKELLATMKFKRNYAPNVIICGTKVHDSIKNELTKDLRLKVSARKKFIVVAYKNIAEDAVIVMRMSDNLNTCTGMLTPAVMSIEDFSLGRISYSLTMNDDYLATVTVK